MSDLLLGRSAFERNTIASIVLADLAHIGECTSSSESATYHARPMYEFKPEMRVKPEIVDCVILLVPLIPHHFRHVGGHTIGHRSTALRAL